MNDIEDNSELFDLFGETGECVVCQEDLKDGERIRLLKNCNHKFHMKCIDPWLLNKSECPLCRKSIIPESYTLINSNNTEDIHENIRTIYTALENSIDDQNLLQRIQQLISTIDADPVYPVERYILTYCFADSILRRFPTAQSYGTQQRLAVRNLMGTYTHGDQRPFPINLASIASIKRARLEMFDEICTRTSYQGTNRVFRQREYVNTICDSIMRQLPTAAVLTTTPL